MSFKINAKNSPVYKFNFQTALGTEFQNELKSYAADIDVVCSHKPELEPLVESKIFKFYSEPEQSLVKAVFELLKISVDLNYLKVTLDDKKTIFYDGKNFLYSYPFVINCAHRHYNPELTEQENKDLYYKCFYPHGHEYQLFITVSTKEDFEFDQLIAWGNTVIVEPFDKTFLNDKMGNTSGELILEFFSEQLLTKPDKNLELVNLTLKETFKNSFVKVYDNGLHYLF